MITEKNAKRIKKWMKKSGCIFSDDQKMAMIMLVTEIETDHNQEKAIMRENIKILLNKASKLLERLKKQNIVIIDDEEFTKN